MTATPTPVSGYLSPSDFVFYAGSAVTRADEFDVSFTAFGSPVQISLNSPNLTTYSPLVQIINANSNAVVASGTLTGNNSVIPNFLPQFNTPYKIRVTSTAVINPTLYHTYTLTVNGAIGDITLSPRLTVFNSTGSSTATPTTPATQIGALNSQDFTFPAPLTGSPSLADEYDFDFVAPGLPVQISLVSANTAVYDPFLQVIAPQTGVVVAQNNDNGVDLNSLISGFMPVAGVDYRIRVTSYNALTLPSTPPFAYILQATVGVGQQVTLTPRSPVSPALSINDVSIVEGNSGTSNLNFTVTLSAPSAQPVTVNYATADQTATAGSDYAATGGTLTFNPGETTKTISVAIVGDTVNESNETFLVNLFSPSNATLADGVGIGTINNDDNVLPILSINNAAILEGDSGTRSLNFTVSLSATSTQPIMVDYATANQSAIAGSDYGATNSTLSFNAGETSKTISVAIVGDTALEGNETFLVNLSNPSHATLGNSQGIGTIYNDDFPIIEPPIQPPMNDPVYRFYQPDTRGHFFTISPSERDNVLAHSEWGYQYEGMACEASATPGNNLFPAYRFFQPDTGGHFFTISPSERDNVLAHFDWGYQFEGIGFYAYGSNSNLGCDVFRFFQPDTGGHFFTMSLSERDNVLAHSEWGYRYEGVGFEAGAI